jgi:protein gp37
MGDLFHPDVPDWYIIKTLVTAKSAHEHTFLFLTKRPQRAIHFFKLGKSAISGEPFNTPPNLYVGVSVENQAAAEERIPLLLEIPTAVRFVSIEPMLGSVNLKQAVDFYLHTRRPWSPPTKSIYPFIDWVICGAETGPGARPMNLAWARDLRDQCQRAGVPFFFKSAGPGKPIPPDLMIREVPQCQNV